MTATLLPAAVETFERPEGEDAHAVESRSSVVDRMTSIIRSFDDRSPSLSLADLTERSGLPKSTVHRMAEQLVDVGWLERVALF